MQRQVRMFALLFFIFSNLSCATRNRDDSPPGRKVVVAINLDAPLLKMIPRDFLVLYVYPSFRTETVENDLSRRAGSESQDDVSCYVNSDADKILGESKLCFQKFLTEFGHIDYVVPRGDEEESGVNDAKHDDRYRDQKDHVDQAKQELGNTVAPLWKRYSEVHIGSIDRWRIWR